jgi:hypothetical protein
MIRSHTEQVTIDREVVDDILCNKCGSSLKDENGYNFEGLTDARVCGGYGAKLGDSVEYTFALCEDCLGALFDTFKHPPRRDAANPWDQKEGDDQP